MALDALDELMAQARAGVKLGALALQMIGSQMKAQQPGLDMSLLPETFASSEDDDELERRANEIAMDATRQAMG